MANRRQLCGELSVRRDRLGEPSSRAPVCRGSNPEADLEKFRAPVLSFARAVFDRLDGPYSSGRSTSRIRRRSICARKCHLCRPAVGDIRKSRRERSFGTCATHDASAIVFDVGSFYDRDALVAQVSAVGLGAGLLLFTLLSTAGSSPHCHWRL